MSSEHSIEQLRQLVADSAERHKICDLHFNQADSDKSGSLDGDEVITLVDTICKDMQIKMPPRSKVEELVKKTDRDGNGSLSLGEFRTLFLVVLKNCLKEAEKEAEEAASKKQEPGVIVKSERNCSVW
eukprot:CAMPEP_0197633970 /NCGR_PEP_ID=MMETSP1338-20131121/10202_1 /TAXON_ID=43686 ORGANISM="Pelagodinium beii, Strain RCC1491" /NCGR_SAMPLE_ID=MMETSP1338 /ASSEMBLY_ACC=CAM_ASM_000754 /LENGTH=127 /DNA_ID=CAMNT_0043205747 /DNA_START=19 /DNA_END=399 /DNA_ORIENTATION=-